MKERKLKLLVYGINYSPELVGIGKYTSEMCEWLAARGHQIEVITSLPYYPTWKVDKKYQGKGWHTEMINNVKVHRCPLYVPKKITGKSRMIHEFSFLLSSFYFWFCKFFKSYDAVIAVYPPLIIGFLPTFYSILRRKPYLLHIQDLQVDAAKELGLIKNKFLLGLLENIEKIYLKKAAKVSSISEGMKERIMQKGLAADKYFPLPNWVDVNFIQPMNPHADYKRKLGFKADDRIVLYSGNMGEKQGLEIILKVAEKFSEEKNILFVLAGEGMMKEKLMSLTKNRNIENVRFLGLQPYEDLPEFLSMAAIHLVIQKKAASDLVMPSKLSGILAAGGLAIVASEKNSSLYKMLTENRVAITIEAENEKMLYEAIKSQLESPDLRMGENARKFAEHKLNIEKILPPLEKLLIDF
jgi:colanic acid biosynthesis glycosyl transferase WcaI